MILQQRYINKSDILEYANDVTIYNTYLEKPLEIGPRIPSPFRKDENPSFGFFKGTSEICWKDFSSGETGDCFEFVKRLYPNFTFFDTLSKIATDLDLPKNKDYFYKDMSHIKTKIRELSEDERNLLIKNATSTLQVRFREWTMEDANFWQDRGVNYNTLLFYNVKPISHIFINNTIIVADKLAYAFAEQKDGQPTYKIYQPFNERGLKWLNSHNSSVWQGWTQLPQEGDEVFITKSLKDVMAIATVLRIPAVAMQSENTKPKESVIKELCSRFKCVYVLYDNDYDKEINVGRLMGESLVNSIRDLELHAVQKEISSQYNSKDFSDLVLNKGRIFAKNFGESLLVPF